MHLLLGVRRWLASVARLLLQERAFSCCSYIEPVARNIDRNIVRAVKTVLASADNSADTNSPSADRNRTRIVLLPQSPVIKFNGYSHSSVIHV